MIEKLKDIFEKKSIEIKYIVPYMHEKHKCAE